MLPRRKRRKANASNWDGLAIPKGPSRREEKDAYDAEESAWIQVIRRLVYARDRKCRACGGPPEHMHEIKTRAMTRGMHFRVRFSRSNCLMLCEACHKRCHAENVGGFWWLIFGTDANVPGDVRFERVEVSCKVDS